MAGPSEEQMVNGRGARDRNGGGNNGGTAERRGSGGDRRDGGSTTTRTGSERRRDTDGDQRVAVRRSPDRDRDRDRSNPPVIVRNGRPNVNINIGSPYGPRYYTPYYYDRWARSYYRWSPLGYAPWPLIYGSIGFSNLAFYSGIAPSTYYYGYNGYYGPGAYSPWQAGGYDIGGIRLKIRPRDAQVFVDGYYAGLVDDFDGSFQSLRVEAGGHKIEIHMPGYEDLELDVHVQPGKTITLEEVLRPRP